MSKFITFKDVTKRKYIINSENIKEISYLDGNQYLSISYKYKDKTVSYFFESARVAEYYFDSILTQLNE